MNNIAVLRKQKGLTQQQLADICGIKREQIARLETKQTNPNTKTLIKITQALNCSLDEVIAHLGDYTEVL